MHVLPDICVPRPAHHGMRQKQSVVFGAKTALRPSVRRAGCTIIRPKSSKKMLERRYRFLVEHHQPHDHNDHDADQRDDEESYLVSSKGSPVCASREVSVGAVDRKKTSTFLSGAFYFAAVSSTYLQI